MNFGTAPLPVTNDPDTAGFWLAAERGEVAVCACANCGAVLHLPRCHCHNCRSWTVEWKVVTPTARLVTWTVAEFQVHPSFPVPYTLVLVELDEAPGVRLAGHLDGRPRLTAGMAMRAEFLTQPGRVTLVNWVPGGEAHQGIGTDGRRSQSTHHLNFRRLPDSEPDH